MMNMPHVLTVTVVLVSVGLIAGQVPGELRLVGGAGSYGRLQVYIGSEWTEICSDGFGKDEADVACHQLGYKESRKNSTIPSISTSDLGNIGLSEVDCLFPDYLNILRCSFQYGQHSCSGLNYVLLECDSTRIWDDPYVGQLRLTGGQYNSEGLVEVYCNGQWGTICDDDFGQNEADTVCRQLGYTHALQYDHLSSLRGSDDDPIWLDDVSCPGSTPQNCLGTCQNCPISEYHDCRHSEDVTIQCVHNLLHYNYGDNVSTCDGFELERPRLGEIRVRDIDSSQDGISSGLVEVLYHVDNDVNNKTWQGICGSSQYDSNNADTVCQQLGYNTVTTYTTRSTSSSSQLTIQCSDVEPHVLRCSVSSGTSCSTLLVVECSNDESLYYSGQLRLVGGEYPSEGRVEIYISDQDVWSSIYDENIDDQAPNSICRQLGYTGAIRSTSGNIPGSGDIWLDYPSCYIEMACFTDCLSSYQFSRSYYSSHDYDLAVNCTFNTSSTVTYGSRSQCEIDYEITHSSGPDTHMRDGLSGGAIAGIVIGVLLFVAVSVGIMIVALVCIYVLSKRSAKLRRATAGHTSGTGSNVAAPGAVVGYTAQGQTVMMLAPGQLPPGVMYVPVGVPVATSNDAPPSYDDEVEKREPPASDEVQSTQHDQQ